MMTTTILLSSTACFADTDVDGFGDAQTLLQRCETPEGYVEMTRTVTMIHLESIQIQLRSVMMLTMIVMISSMTTIPIWMGRHEIPFIGIWIVMEKGMET